MRIEHVREAVYDLIRQKQLRSYDVHFQDRLIEVRSSHSLSPRSSLLEAEGRYYVMHPIGGPIVLERLARAPESVDELAAALIGAIPKRVQYETDAVVCCENGVCVLHGISVEDVAGDLLLRVF